MTVFQSPTPPIARDTLVTEPGGCFRSRCLRVSETHAADHLTASIRITRGSSDPGVVVFEPSGIRKSISGHPEL